MYVAIDVGNTQTKVGFFDGPVLREQRQWPHLNDLPSLVSDPQTEAVIISSVAAPVAHPALALSADLPVITLTADTPLPFTGTYPTLGTDRIAAVAGAQQHYPRQAVLVVDVGTCITYDVLDAQARYRGGLISPGIRLRLRAMHAFTARLPQVAPGRPEPMALTAHNTPDSLRGGAVRGAAAEINEMIRMYTDKFPDLRVIMCGGDVPYLSPPSSVSIVPELILVGLNSILQYNVHQKN